ncbi:MAG: carboxypeptidase-like regulatory domain-containing protein, partial [Bacteroidales bacterium]|nr:carboxypeptidase-like regulatory domain-containing protein [Bacteroidales bacterium]
MKIILHSVLLLSFILLYGFVSAQTGIVKGTVTDENGEPLYGTNVVVKGKSIGVITDFDGKYTLNDVPIGVQIIEVSFIGLKTQEFSVTVEAGKIFTLDAVMIEDAVVLDDVIVIGYGRRQKRDVTGAITSIGAED